MQIRRGNLIFDVDDDGSITIIQPITRIIIHTDIDELEQMVNEARHYLNQQDSAILEELDSD